MEGGDSVAQRRVSLARSRAGKRAYRKRQRKEAIKEFGENLISLIPGAGIAKTAYGMGKSYEKFRRNW